MPTLRAYRQELSRKLGGFKAVPISLDPDLTDNLAQRSVLSGDLFDSDKGSKAYSGQWCWAGKYGDQRRFRDSGYRALPYTVYSPPASGNYTITLYGFGVTDPIAFDASTGTIQTAIQDVATDLNTLTVSGGGSSPIILNPPDIIDIEISAGTMLSNGGIGAIEVQRGFTKALVMGDEVEIHSKLPVADDDNIQGMNTLLNMALRRIWFIDRFPITPVINSRGVQTFYGLSGEDWLTHRNQLIGLYDSTLWELSAAFTPPGSSTYTLQLTIAPDTFITSSLAYNATGQQIQDALRAASDRQDITVSPLSTDTDYTVSVAETYYADITLSASAGTVTNTRTMLEQPQRYPQVWSFEYDGETPFIRNYVGQEGYSFYVEAYRPGHSWVCPQASYGVLGDTWEVSSNGLVDDYDQAVPNLEDTVAVAYAFACRQLATVGPAGEQAHWEREALTAERASAVTKLYDLPFNDKPSGGGSTYMSSSSSKGFW